MLRDRFESYLGRRRIPTAARSVYDSPGGGIELGEITRLYEGRHRYRCDIRTFQGTTLRRVRLPGPAYTRTGKLIGIKSGVEKNQLAAIAYIGGRRDAPIIIQTFAFSASDLTRYNLAASAADEYDPAVTEIGAAGGSYREAWEEDRKVIYDSTGETVFEMNFETKTVTLRQGWRFVVEGANPATSAAIDGMTGSVVASGYIQANGVSGTPGTPPVGGQLVASNLIVVGQTATGVLKIAGADYATHLHGGVMSGPAVTGPPL